jgi:hypothetical protein
MSSHLRPLPPARLAGVRFAFSTRRVETRDACLLATGDVQPRAGDVVLARVTQVGHHRRLELPSGRRSDLREGDEIVVAYGNRYAPDQFEAEVPPDLGPCHLAAGGGLAGIVVSRHESASAPTALEPIGLLAREDGKPMTLADWALPEPPDMPRPLTMAVVGDSMNGGKTTTAAGLVAGLCAQGRRVGAAKVTGTGAGGDLWRFGDAGAARVLDFTDAGHVSTYRLELAELERVLATLTGHLVADRVDAMVLEVADGLLQAETAALVSSAAFADTVDHVFLAAQTALSAAAGVDWLRERALPPVAVSGAVAQSPLALREAVSVTGLPVVTPGELRDPHTLEEIVARPAAVAA